MEQECDPQVLQAHTLLVDGELRMPRVADLW